MYSLFHSVLNEGDVTNIVLVKIMFNLKLFLFHNTTLYVF